MFNITDEALTYVAELFAQQGEEDLGLKVDIEKATNGHDADTKAEAVHLTVDDAVMWSYVVTNTGDEQIDDVAVTDDKEGAVTCPKTSLAAGESMTCTPKTGTAAVGNYENTATATATGHTSGTSVMDADPSHYIVSPYAHIGDYFWIDTDNDGIQDPDEKPVVGAEITLFDSEGNPIKDIHGNHSVTTDDNGKYGFDVEPGKTYQVHFSIPQEYQDDGYVFTSQNTGDNTQDSDVDTSGFTATVNPVAGENILTIDAGINCGCGNITSDSIGMMNLWLFLLYFLGIGLVVMTGLQRKTND